MPQLWQRDGTECGARVLLLRVLLEALSRREREILALIADGLSNAEIAARLGIRDKTVRNHVSHLFDKIGVWSRAQAIVFARDRGFVS